MQASHRKSFVGLFFGFGSVRALQALTEPNPKNNGPQNFFVTEAVTGLNVLTPPGGDSGPKLTKPNLSLNIEIQNECFITLYSTF